jgi:hypothetical protein
VEAGYVNRSHRLVGKSFSAEEFRVPGTAREQHLMQRGLRCQSSHVTRSFCIEVVLCNAAAEFLMNAGLAPSVRRARSSINPAGTGNVLA